MKTGGKRLPYVITAVEKAVRLLKQFLMPPHEYGITELADLLETNKNQVFRLVKTLEKNGLLQLNPATGKYCLGYMVYVLGEIAEPTNALLLASKPTLDELVERTEETLHLTVLDGDVAVCIDKRERNHGLKLTAKIGLRVPSLHAGACPKLLLAYIDDEERRKGLISQMPMTKFTQSTITSAKDLEKEVALIRQRGYSISDEDVDPGARGVAVPIFNAGGKVAAALSAGGPVVRVTYERLEELRQLITTGAYEISCRLGYDGAPQTV
jgi:DNA-binding IclR family transcriptional regulator